MNELVVLSNVSHSPKLSVRYVQHSCLNDLPTCLVANAPVSIRNVQRKYLDALPSCQVANAPVCVKPICENVVTNVSDHDLSFSDQPVISTVAAEDTPNDWNTNAASNVKRRRQTKPAEPNGNSMHVANEQVTSQDVFETVQQQSYLNAQRRRLKGEETEHGNSFELDGFYVSQASASHPSISSALTRIDCVKNISRCRARMYEQPEALYRPAAAVSCNMKRPRSLESAPSGPKTGVMRLQPLSVSNKRHKMCNPKTGLASSCRGVNGSSLTCRSGTGPTEISSSSRVPGHNQSHAIFHNVSIALGSANLSSINQSSTSHGTGHDVNFNICADLTAGTEHVRCTAHNSVVQSPDAPT